ncbi:MAG TPA: hypothetical protein DCG78_03560 [Anaerolineaceae bacterium]|nr:MAG: hypothetical protein XD89_0917 [Anaerolineae bacterium 49_20]HAE85572.1 hypothetical protein [Anaerolineaceae bacterium]
MQLSAEQKKILALPFDQTLFLHGLAGTGKTTLAGKRMLQLLREAPDEPILVLTPQRTLAFPYRKLLEQAEGSKSYSVNFATMNTIARRMVALFWPLFSEQAGFHFPYRPPQFLTLETAQFYLGKLIDPMLDQGAFSSVSIPRHRLYSQVLDNLNKSAVVGFPYTEIGAKLSAAWVGESSQLNVYADLQVAVNAFRSFCLENNLLDFSLQVQLFREFVWQDPLCRRFLTTQFQHLIYDNCEEDPPYGHDIITEWLPSFKSALIVYDEQAGYRVFLGADPYSAWRLHEQAQHTRELTQSFTTSPEVALLRNYLVSPEKSPPFQLLDYATLTKVLRIPEQPLRFYQQMLTEVANQIHELVEAGTKPGQIAVLAPFVNSSSGFAMQQALSQRGIRARIFRPSIPLIEDAVIQCFITLAELIHPEWHLPLAKTQLTNCLTAAIDGLDMVRARLLVDNLVNLANPTDPLKPFDALAEAMQARITPKFGSHYEQLRIWLSRVDRQLPLDIFVSQLFGEVLSQPGFGFHQNISAGQSTNNLMESYRKFRYSVNLQTVRDHNQLSLDYVRTLLDGVISAQYLSTWQNEDPESVLIAPALTFLVSGQSVDYQVWLSVGSSGWYERLEQPLTHPYVLSRAWPEGKKWTSEEESRVSNANLEMILAGLLSRCRKGIILGLSEYNQAGQEEKGLLLARLQGLLRQSLKETGHA